MAYNGNMSLAQHSHMKVEWMCDAGWDQGVDRIFSIYGQWAYIGG